MKEAFKSVDTTDIIIILHDSEPPVKKMRTIVGEAYKSVAATGIILHASTPPTKKMGNIVEEASNSVAGDKIKEDFVEN